MSEIIAVLTTETAAAVIASGATQPWHLNRKRAAVCEYVVLCRNARKSQRATKAHGSAFMIGRIKAVVPSTKLPGRWAIELIEYAEIDWPQQPFVRNPTSYRAEEEYYRADETSCDFRNLNFKPIPSTALPFEQPFAGAQPAIASAKVWLAANLSLPESSIEITIRA